MPDSANGEYRSALSWVEYLALLLPLWVALSAVFTKAGGLFLDQGAWLGIPLAFATLVSLVVLDPLLPARRRRSPALDGLGRHDRPARRALAASQFIVGGLFLMRIGVDLVPRAASSDFGSHGGLVTWIAEHQAMPSPSRWGASVAAYPSGGHLAAASLSWVTPLRPLEALWAMTLVALLGTWPILCLLARQVAWRHSWFASALVLVFLFGAYRYTVGIVTYDYFFAQMTGQWLALAGVARVVVETARLRSGQPDGNGSSARLGIAALWVLGLLAGAVLSYPQASVLLLGSIAAVILFGPFPRRIRYGLMAACVVLAAMFLFALSRTIYWSADLLAGIPGEVARVRISDLGGPLMLGLAGVGAMLVLMRGRRAPQNIACLGAAAGPLAVVLGMVSLRAGFPVRLAVSDYRIAKNVYGLVPLVVVVAAVGAAAVFGWLWGQLAELIRRPIRQSGRASWVAPSAAPWVPTLAAGLAAVLSLSAVRAPTVAVRRIYDHDLYRLGLAIPAADRASVALVAPWVEVYVMRWAGIGLPISPDDPAEFPRTERWRTWPDSKPDSKPDFLPDSQIGSERLLVAGPFAQRYRDRPDVVVERELGSAVLLRRK